jgi:hypothetical protein
VRVLGRQAVEELVRKIDNSISSFAHQFTLQ